MRTQKYVWLSFGWIFRLVDRSEHVAVLTKGRIKYGPRIRDSRVEWSWEIYRVGEWLKHQADLRAWDENDDTTKDLDLLIANRPTALRYGTVNKKSEAMAMAVEALREVK